MKKIQALLGNKEILIFEFLFFTIIWHDILFSINSISKFLQIENMDIDVLIIQLKRADFLFSKVQGA